MKNTLKVINELVKDKLIKNYAIGGAIGVLKWTEPFFTRDLDIFIIPIQEIQRKEILSLSEIYDYLKTKGYSKWVGQWLIIEGIPVEFIPATDGLFREAVENAVETKFEDIKAKVIIPEYLIALFLKAKRAKDIIKIEMLLKQTKVNKEKLKEVLLKYNLNEVYKKFVKRT